MLSPCFYSLWAINGPLVQSRLRRQLDQLRSAGMDGVVFHPRFYPNDPPYLGDHYLQEVSDAILYAKSIGLAFWIYDEDGWPSGTVGGQLLRQFPQDAQRWAELVTEKPERCLCEFEREGRKWFVAERTGAGVDYFSSELTRHFLKLTHERYRAGLAPEAWEYVGAIFCDEPEFGLGHAYDSLSKHGAIPWTPKLPQIFQQRHGEDLLSLLPQLFLPGKNSGATRVKFWELLTDVFNESFTVPINDWCLRHGKRFTAHVKGEEHPLFQVPTSGSCQQFFRHLSLPGIDALERFPANDFYPRQVASVAQQFGDGRCMVEAFGGAGWGATPEDLERYLLWLGRHGLTDFVLHLSQYQLTSAAIRDWPPSQPLHVNWAPAFPQVLRRVRQSLRENPPSPADTLVVAPYRGIMAAYEPWEFLQTNVHNAATYPDTPAGKLNRRFLDQIHQLHAAGVSCHVTDERTLETQGENAALGIRLGNCVYAQVIVAEGADLNATCRLMLERAGDGQVTGSPTTPAKVIEIQKPETVLESIDLEWSLLPEGSNALLLEPVATPDHWFVAEFDFAAQPPPAHALEFFFADSISEASCNDFPLALTECQHGMIGRLTGTQINTSNRLRFRCLNSVVAPLAWLHGEFRMVSQTPFTPGPNGTVVTDGPFLLSGVGDEPGHDLIRRGFPFRRTPLKVETAFHTTGSVNSLQLRGVQADAARVTLNGVDLGWIWGPDWRIPVDLPPGRQTLCLEMIPNTFNYFGPHHYFAGDRHVISPDQFSGQRNFADPDGAPAHTLVPAWHFRRFELPTAISVR